MPDNGAPITVTFKVEGTASEIVEAMQNLRVGRRSAVLQVYSGSRGPRVAIPNYHLPEIADGDSRYARKTVVDLYEQTRIAKDTMERAQELISELEKLTR